MSKFVSCNAKYYKQSQVKGLSGHHTREFENDANVLPEFTPYNFTTKLNPSFNELERKMVEVKRAAGKKSSNLEFRKNANVLVDNVLIFSREQVRFLMQKDPQNLRANMQKCGTALAAKIQREFGLTPMDIHWHFDEGHFDESGNFRPNYHAHMTFFNFDFQSLEQPLRKMKRSDFSKIQDFAAEAFKELGFERGVKKSITGKEHKEKAEFLSDKLSAVEAQKREIESEIQSLQKEKEDLVSGCARMEKMFQGRVNQVKSVVKELEALQDELTTIKGQANPREYAQVKKIERLERENAELREQLGIREPEEKNSAESGLDNLMRLPRS